MQTVKHLKMKKFYPVILLVFSLTLLSTNTAKAGANYIYTDNFRDLIYKIGTSETTRHHLATVAHALGYCWCGGTGSSKVGEDMRVWLNGNNVHIRGNYRSNDPHADGVTDWQMLEMVLHNFRYDIRPNNIYLDMDNKTVHRIDTITTATDELINRDTKRSAEIQSWMSYTSSATLYNEVSGNITNSIRIQTEVKAEWDLGYKIGGATQYEFKAEESRGWVNHEETATSTTHTVRAIATVAPNSKKIAKVVMVIDEASIPYSIGTGIIFNVTFKGYLRDSGNARWDHPTGRPYVEYTFGNDDEDCYESIYYSDRYGSGTWDWNWARSHTSELDWYLDNIYENGVRYRNMARVFLEGRFRIRGDTNTWIDYSDNMPLVGNVRILNGRYSIHPVFNSGSACDAAGTHKGANIMQYEYHGGTNQIWQIRQVNGEWHRIMSDKNGSRAWDIAGYSTANHANLQLYDYWEGNCQLFKLQKAGAGKTRIVARHSMKCVDVAGGNTANHTNIVQWDCIAGASNQIFYIWER